ncbi:DUF2946 family protein [Herbaspirillum sp. HC18]|nr:DUF2946 family protein [Herbaspirillum sp. HC18]
MDEIVKQAMAKWPNVPHCYGWLSLDARGNWRMRDERAQALRLAGDRINNSALLGFINRNYMCDTQGRWYFQNGPQRVYVNLEATPFIVRTDPSRGFVLHTGETLEKIDAAWMTETGLLLLKNGEKVALIDDRDMAHCLTRLHIDGEQADDERILNWLGKPSDTIALTLEFAGTQVPVAHIANHNIAAHFGFIAQPQPDTAAQSG